MRPQALPISELGEPEQALWTFVLSTFIVDMEQFIKEGNYDACKELLEYAEDDWTEFMCDAVGMSHSFFVDKLNRLFLSGIRH